MLLLHRTLVLVLVNNKTIYQVYVFLSNSELDDLASQDEYLADSDAVMGTVVKAGWSSSLGRDRPTEDAEGNAGIEITFEVQTIEERDRLLAWLKTDPFTTQGLRRDQD